MITSPTIDAALTMPRRTDAQVHAFFDGVRRLANVAAVELDVAMTIAWLSRRDPEELGYSSLGGFYAEHVDWSAAWRKALVALVNSDLDAIKRAVADGRVPLRVAVTAPGRVRADEQEVWLAAPRMPARPDPRTLEPVFGADADVVREARRAARVCLGGGSAREVDDHLLACHRDGTPGDVIVERARVRPSRPPEQPPLSWQWCGGSAPASVADALARLAQGQAILAGRTATLARAWVIARDEALWTCLPGDAGPADLAEQVFGVSLRQAQRWCRLGWQLVWEPTLDAAIRAGLSPRSAAAIATVVCDREWPDWLALAARVGRRELARAVADARDEPTSWRTFARYRTAVALADRVATSAGSTAIRVAIPHEPKPRERPEKAPIGLVAAARWWVDHVRMPRPTGFQAIKVRDAWTCRNPWCGRTSLRSEAHHVIPRSAGGPDDPANGLTVCRACHLRGLHGGRIAVERLEIDGRVAHLWTHADGRRVLALDARPDPS